MPRREKLKAALREVFHNEPSTVKRANVSGSKKRKMMIAIAFSKVKQRARKRYA